MEGSKKANIPKQHVGSKLDTDHVVTASTEREAREIFSMAVERLLDVNCWEKLCGPLSASFQLTDNQGNEIDTPAKPGDHFKIKIPAPGPASGRGYDWVRVEALEDKRDPAAVDESVTLRVRPTDSPITKETDTAHFFKETATSSFRVRRSGNVVTAAVHGRNEVPNVEAEKAVDKMRNVVVGTSAVAGVAYAQWNSLVKGLLDPSIEV